MIMIVVSFVLLIFLSRYLKVVQRRRREKELLKYQLPIWMRHVHCLLQNHTVYHSLVQSRAYVPVLLKDDFEELMEGLTHHPDSYDVYKDLMKKHQSHEIQKMMQALYRYQQLDKAKAQVELEEMMIHGGNWLKKVRQEKMASFLSGMEMMGLLPLLITGIFMMVQMATMMVEMISQGWSI